MVSRQLLSHTGQKLNHANEILNISELIILIGSRVRWSRSELSLGKRQRKPVALPITGRKETNNHKGKNEILWNTCSIVFRWAGWIVYSFWWVKWICLSLASQKLRSCPIWVHRTSLIDSRWKCEMCSRSSCTHVLHIIRRQIPPPTTSNIYTRKSAKRGYYNNKNMYSTSIPWEKNVLCIYC